MLVYTVLVFAHTNIKHKVATSMIILRWAATQGGSGKTINRGLQPVLVRTAHRKAVDVCLVAH